MRLAALIFSMTLVLAACGGRSQASGTAQADASPDDVGAEDASAPVDARADAAMATSDAGIDETSDVGSAVCSVAADCLTNSATSIYCCIDHACGSELPDACADGGEKLIVASNYDQTCTSDTDCVAIAEGNACSMVGPCLTAAINNDSYAQYQTDIVGTPCYGVGSCAIAAPGCCVDGTCQQGSACNPVRPTDDSACTSAGGTCTTDPFAFTCGTAGLGEGPSNSCTMGICCVQ